MLDTMKPSSNTQLRELVATLITQRGVDCNLNGIDVSGVYCFDGVFSDTVTKTFTGDISKWDVSNATSMKTMFKNSAFNGSIADWNVSRVESMHEMFYQARFQGDLSNWNTTNVRDMSGMFQGACVNDISRWSVSNVQTMRSMFELAQVNTKLDDWNVGQVKDMSRMFVHSTFKGDIARWNVAQCTAFDSMFAASWFSGDVAQWQVSNNASLKDTYPQSLEKVGLEPNFYHWAVLTVRRGEDITKLPQAWKAHAQDAMAVAQTLGIAATEVWYFAKQSWDAKWLATNAEFDASMLLHS